ncbi:M20 metallopeptidase family protein [Ructibacterium gallinarum]|uniref:Amidohydrolase n=1 Tax=Ructibacterium gallinarum TaxID=2779355 RepID=A0A9D5M1C3_9FIRM|nr:M20 family metallopeptidase [Ructibacterium gallinarum]MBE5039623.1 amidohydrolase [Ructibacterium gallinarum]
MKADALIWAEKIQEKMRSDRRCIHQTPELSFQEFHTMQYICSRLDTLRIPYKKEIAGSGVVAQINGNRPANGNRPGKCLLLRADMDALPLQEENTSVYRSQKNGIMHACGHDAHTAILLGVCEILNDHRDHFSGIVKLVFQPGEETTGGAAPMIQAGVLEHPAVDACIALHVDPDLDAGTIRIKPGALYASPDDFRITIKGRGGHGAQPHLAVDPIITAAQIVTQLQTIISRNTDPFEQAVITVGSLHAGDTSNVIPETAEIFGTARALSNQMRHFLKKRIYEITKGVCEAYGANFCYDFIFLYPPLINDAQLASKLLESGCHVLGKKHCVWGGLPTMAGEDFAYFAEKCPSVLFKLGCRNTEKGITEPIHSPRFDIDETCLQYGAAVFTDFALRFLA